MNLNSKETVPFQTIIAAGANSYFDYLIPSDGTIEEIKMVFALGQRFGLRLNAAILQSGSKILTPLIPYVDGCDKFVAGDNTTLDLKTIQPVNVKDVLRVFYNNTSAESLHMACYVTVDYYGGTRRVL